MDFETLGYEQALGAIPDRSATWLAENAAFYHGDHWQSGAGWTGPRLAATHALYAETWATIQSSFVSSNKIREVVRREVMAARLLLVEGRVQKSQEGVVHLMARLRIGGFRLLDVQFLTPHLASLGAIEISRDDYQKRLRHAVGQDADFGRMPYASDGASAWHEITQAS